MREEENDQRGSDSKEQSDIYIEREGEKEGQRKREGERARRGGGRNIYIFKDFIFVYHMFNQFTDAIVFFNFQFHRDRETEIEFHL